MTEGNNTMTMEQAQQEMKEYRKVFDVVRLIGEESIRKARYLPGQWHVIRSGKKVSAAKTVSLHGSFGRRGSGPNWNFEENRFTR